MQNQGSGKAEPPDEREAGPPGQRDEARWTRQEFRVRRAPLGGRCVTTESHTSLGDTHREASASLLADRVTDARHRHPGGRVQTLRTRRTAEDPERTHAGGQEAHGEVSCCANCGEGIQRGPREQGPEVSVTEGKVSDNPKLLHRHAGNLSPMFLG